MPNPRTGDQPDRYHPANDQRQVDVTPADLPLHCPMPGSALWASHPRVYLPIQDARDGRILCPYCGTQYRLKR